MITRKLLIALMTLVLGLSVNMAVAFDDMPDQVNIDVMAKYFDPVEFDHEMHTELGEDCSACHHHTTGTGTTAERCIQCHANDDEVDPVGCSDCHVIDPFSAAHINREAENLYQFHIDKPGLKAAYHWNCMGCHEEMDGPTGCQDCHARNADGEAFYRAAITPAVTDKEGH